MITTTLQRVLKSLNQRTARAGGLVRHLDQTEKVVAVLWDFSVDGGANATDINLDYTTEEACVLTKIVMHEITNVVGATSTYTLYAGSTALSADVAVASMATGTMALASSATAIAVATGEQIKLNIGTADATAGKVRFYLYFVPQRDMGTGDY